MRGLSVTAKAVLPYYDALWMRPEQHLPEHGWRTCGFTGGRGLGKSRTIARWITARVRAGKESQIALMAPSEARVLRVQIKALIDYAPPWFKPVIFNKVCLRWPNGVEAIGVSPGSKAVRGDNLSLAWATEIVDWSPGPREDALSNMMLATRKGEARMVWDSTAKGRNEVRTALEELNAADPAQHVIVPGTTFDNPIYASDYLRSAWVQLPGVRRDEELFGISFREAAGAMWKQASFDRTRVAECPALDWICVAVDPAISTHKSSDETGIMVGGRSRDGHAYCTHDLSGTHDAGVMADLAIDHADPRKPGPQRGRMVVERKHVGHMVSEVMKGRAESRQLRTRVLGPNEPWPPFDRTCIFIREQNTNLSKGTRAEGPASETELGRVHLVDPGFPDAPRFADLETECTTYVDGATTRSPNRLDAFAYLILELRELRLDSPPDRAADFEQLQKLQAAMGARSVTPPLFASAGLTLPSKRTLGL